MTPSVICLHRAVRIGCLLLLIGLVGGSVSPVRAQQQADGCASEYEQAEAQYFAANFNAAINLLQTCLQDASLSEATRVRIYRLLSFAYIAQGSQQQARLAVESLLDLRPDYTPDPAQDRPDFVRLVREIKASRQPATSDTADEGRRWVRWALGGAGVAAAGVLTIVLVGGGNGGGGGNGLSPLPDQPPLPNE